MSQALSKIYTHLVFSTKNRTKTIPNQYMAEIHAYVAGILNELKCTAICVGGTDDHIHILYLQNRTMALSDVVRIVKTNSSKWINEKKLHTFRWQAIAISDISGPKSCTSNNTGIIQYAIYIDSGIAINYTMIKAVTY